MHSVFVVVGALLCLSFLPNLSQANPSNTKSKQPSAPHGRPNVIVILADDLGYGDLSCYGHPKFKTPHLDRMAREGVRMTQFQTPMAFCAPTRAALLTGRSPIRCGLTANPTPDAGPLADALFLPADEVLLGQWLQKAGYATAMVGKWHLGHKRDEYLPTHRGFGDYLGIAYSNDMRPVRLLKGTQVLEYPVVQATLTRRYTDHALDFLEKNKERPFFLYFAHAMPHKPLACSEAFYKKSGAGLYGDVLAELDWSVGRLLDKLRELKLDERTLVIFTSDNGAWFGGSTGGLRGMKGTNWEGGHRVPCLARWPGRIPTGRVNHDLGVTMDVAATVLAAAGVNPGRVLDGRDLLPTWRGDKSGPHEVLLGLRGPQVATIRDARWKLHLMAIRDNWAGKDKKERWIDPRGPDGVTILAPYEQNQPTEFPGLRTGDATTAGTLFDLQQDPAEQRDVAAANPAVVARLRAVAEKMAAELKRP